jgi:hypothetical protein
VFIVLVALIAAILSIAQVWGFAVGPARSGALSWPRVAVAWAASAWAAGLVLRVADYVNWRLATGPTRQLTLGDALLGMAVIGAVAFGIAGLICRRTALGRRRVPTVGALMFGLNCAVAGPLTMVFWALFTMPPH